MAYDNSTQHRSMAHLDESLHNYELIKPISSSSISAASLSSLSLASSARSKDSSPIVAPHIRYQSSPLSNMSSLEYQEQQQQEDKEPLKAQKKHSTQEQGTTTTANDPMDYLEYLEKEPVAPPTYAAANPSPRVRFPVYETIEANELPDYSPSIHQIALVLRKAEWLSPYEPSPIRNWKNLVMELNSTQLNFYSIDNLPLLRRVKKSKTKNYYEFTPIENEFILNAVRQNSGEYATNKRLVKSYSLQFARFGLPVDYKKKNNCLRIRAESEQFLLHFHAIDEMISWANYLSIGINVSLEIDTRPMPTDRIVPRRRRNRRCSNSNRNRSYSDSELIRRELTPTKRRSSFSGESSIKNKISRIFRKKSNTSLVSIEELTKSFKTSTISSSTSIPTVNSFTYSTCSSFRPSEDIETTPFPRLISDEAESIRNEITTIREEEEEQDDEGEANSVHELHDDSDDKEDDDESINNDQSDLFNGFQFNFNNEKSWKPDYKIMTRRKFLKDSLRCIKLLTDDEEWVGKLIVKSSSPPKFETANHIKAGKYSRNKFVKEYIVGPRGLVSVC